MRGISASLCCVIALSVMIVSAVPDDRPEEVDFTDAADLVAFSVGDWFSYDVTIGLSSADLTFSGYGFLTLEVSSIETRDVSGATYDVYNLTLNGDVPGVGTIVYQGFQVDFEFDTMLLSGYLLMERANLALVRADIIVDADGRARPLLVWNPLHVDAVLAGNANPSAELFDFPVFVDDTWQLSSSAVLGGNVHIVLESVILPIDVTEPFALPFPFQADILCYEKAPVTTPAGTFDAYLISTSDGSTALRFSSDVGSFVTADMTYSDVSSSLDVHLLLGSYYRAPFPISVEENLIPSIVNVGGLVFVEGQTAADANVRVWIPESWTEWSTTTDGSGYYNVTITAPISPDNTPTDYDYGSHGVIVEASKGGLTGTSVATLTTVVPDLHFTSPDLNLSDVLIEDSIVSVSAGFETTEDVHQQFNVTFCVDGIPEQTTTVPWITTGSEIVFKTNWTAVLGSHELSLKVDSGDVVIEESELNNTLTKSVMVYPNAYPDPIEFVRADLTGQLFEDMTIEWTHPADNGVPITEYEVLRSAVYSSNASGYNTIATIAPVDSLYVDYGMGEGDGSNYFYVVCATNVLGLASCSNAQAGKFTRSLNRGIELVSLPVIPSTNSIDIVLQTVDYRRAWSYDSMSGEWLTWMQFKPYRGDLHTIDRSMGVWLDVTEDCNFTVAGLVPSQTTINLRKGWNLVGFPSFGSATSVDGMRLAVGIMRVEGYTQTADPYHLSVLDDDQMLFPGQAYWFLASDDVDWVIVDQ